MNLMELLDLRNGMISKMRYKSKAGRVLNLFYLDQTSVSPLPIARQKVSTCLKVFCNETATAAALETHLQLDYDAVSGTANFIKFLFGCEKYSM